jgi:hypothetical protein
VIYGNIAQRLRLHKNARGSADLRLRTPGSVDLNPIKRYANLFETMVGAYWVQPGVTYEEVFNWIDMTFRPLFYAAEQDVRNTVKAKQNEGARSKTENRDAKITTAIINNFSVVPAAGPPPTCHPIRELRPGPVTRSNAARARALHPPQPQPLEGTVAIKPPSSPPTKRARYERTGPVLNLPYVWNTIFWLDMADGSHSQEVVDLTMEVPD